MSNRELHQVARELYVEYARHKATAMVTKCMSDVRKAVRCKVAYEDLRQQLHGVDHSASYLDCLKRGDKAGLSSLRRVMFRR